MKKILFLRETQSPISAQLGAQLEAEGFCVDHPSHDTPGWLEDVQTFQPDIILMEVLPDNYVARYPFCHQLKQEPKSENIPILLLGAVPDNGNGKSAAYYLLEGLEAGANDYLKAPYEIVELVGKINAALRLKTTLEKSQVLSDQLNSLNEELYQRNIQVEKELHVARQLQQSLLPKVIPMSEENELGPMYTKVHYEDDKVRVSGIYLPCDALGGDLYDVIKLRDRDLGVSITDVSGHGLPAGFITAIFKACLYRTTQQTSDPSEVLYNLNNEMYDIVKTGDYVTSIYLNIDLETMTLQCSGAGHPYPFYYKADEGTMHRLKENGTPLVWVRDMPYPKDTLELKPGDKIFMFTDGVSELKNLSHEMFGEERTEQILMQAIASGEPYITDTIIGCLSDFTEGAALEDDISMVLIEAL